MRVSFAVMNDITMFLSLTEKLNVLNTKYEATHNNSVKMKEMYNNRVLYKTGLFITFLL